MQFNRSHLFISSLPVLLKAAPAAPAAPAQT